MPYIPNARVITACMAYIPCPVTKREFMQVTMHASPVLFLLEISCGLLYGGTDPGDVKPFCYGNHALRPLSTNICPLTV